MKGTFTRRPLAAFIVSGIALLSGFLALIAPFEPPAPLWQAMALITPCIVLAVTIIRIHPAMRRRLLQPLRRAYPADGTVNTGSARIWGLYATVLCLLTAGAPQAFGQTIAQATNGERSLSERPTNTPESGRQKTAQRKAETLMDKQESLLNFEQNVGQFPEAQLLYRATDAQATYFFSKNEIRSVVASAKDSLQTAYALQFVGANENVDIKAFGKPRPERGATNYITAAGTFSDVPMHNQLLYDKVWDGVDAHFYESREGKGTLKYDFIVQPNADPSVVRLKMDGVKDLKINAKGELEFTTPFGALQKGKPYTYQIIEGKKVEIASEYTLDEQGEIGFKIGKYDPSLSLVIDPIALKWSSYLGGAGDEEIYDIYVHPVTGRIYVVGYTTNAGFPNTLGRAYAGGRDAFVTCIEKDGSAIVWSTLLGGSGNDIAYTLYVDAANDVYVGGRTASPNFPVNGTVAAYDATYNGGGTDHFVVRLNSTGTTLKYGTYIGGSGSEGNSVYPRKLVVVNGAVTMGASSFSTNYPTTGNAFLASANSTAEKAVWFRINTNVAGTAGLEYSTYLANESGHFTEVEQDQDGNIWFVGYGNGSVTFPITANAIQKYTEFAGNTGDFNIVAKFSPGGQLLYCSYVCPLLQANSNTNTQYAPSLDLDAAGNVYVAAGATLYNTSPTTLKKSSAIQNFYELSPLSSLVYFSHLLVGYVAKIPYSLAPQYEFVSIFESNIPDNNADPEVAVDKKGNIHLLTHGGHFNGNPI